MVTIGFKSLALAFLLLAMLGNINAVSTNQKSAMQLRAAGPVIDDETFVNYARSFVATRTVSEDDGENEADLLKRAHHKKCAQDYECGYKRYCSTKRHRCYRKLRIRQHCSRDAACRSGYCGRRTHGCALKKSNGRKCFNANAACKSGYCDPTTNTCQDQGQTGDQCTKNTDCKSGTCINGKCTDNGSPTSTNTPPVESGKA